MPLTQRINRQHTRMARVPPTAAVAVAIVLTLMGCNERFDEVPETFLDEPAWLASTQAPTLESREDVLTLWQSEKRCCDDDQALFDNAKVLYKACYMAIANDSGNRDLVAQCLKLMTHQMPAPIVRTIHGHYLENYFDYRAPTDDCVNCLPGDHIARVSQDYARSIAYAGNHKGALARLQHVLDKRGNEISPFIKMDLHANMAWYYQKSSFDKEDLAALQQAYTDLEPQPQSSRGVHQTYARFGKAIERLRESAPGNH